MTVRKILLMRHAEKPDSQAGIAGVDEEGRPDARQLSVRGWQRAGALVPFFAPFAPPGRPDGRCADARIETPHAILAAPPRERSVRPGSTVLPLARRLGLPVRCDFGRDAAVAQLLAALRGIEVEVVLVCWRHDDLAEIARGLAGDAAGIPADWDEARFDLVWVLEREGAGWRFGQVPQRLLAGDGEPPAA